MVEPISRIEEKNKVFPFPPVFEKKDSYSFGEESLSSVAPAEKKEPFSPSKPILDPIQNTIAQYVGKFEPVMDRWSRLKEGIIETEFKKIDQLHRDEAIKLEEAYRASKEVSFWGILEDVGNSIMSAVSFFFGFSAMSAGATAVGGALIVSGVLSLTNLAFKHANVWDWTADQIAGKNNELKQKLRIYLPPAIGVAAAAMGIYGSYAAWNYTAQTGWGQATSLLQSTASVATGMVAFTKGMSHRSLKLLTADLDLLHSNFEFSKLSLERYSEEVKEFHERQTQVHAVLEKILEETKQAIQTIQQPV